MGLKEKYMKPQIYFDKSGNTGYNILDFGQPMFTLVSHIYTEDEAREILRPLFPIVGNDKIRWDVLRRRW